MVSLGGPPLVKMATGEDAEPESIGGADMHCRVSGLGDYLAQDEMDGIRLCRDVIAHLNWRKEGPGPSLPPDDPVLDPEELLGLVSRDLRSPLDIREVIGRVVDGSRFEEFKPLLRADPGLRLVVDPRLPGGHPGQQRRAVLRVGGEGDPVHPALQPDRCAAALPAQHHRLHRRYGLRAGRDHEERLEDDQRGRELDRAASLGDRRRVLRGRQTTA